MQIISPVTCFLFVLSTCWPGLLSCGGPTLSCGPGTIQRGSSCVPALYEPSPHDAGNPPKEQRTEAPHEAAPPELRAEQIPEQPVSSYVGEDCKVDTDCASKTCLSDGYCSKTCKEKTECPVGMDCLQITQRKDGKWLTFTGCVRPAPQRKFCQRDADCPSQQSCVIGLSTTGDALIRFCAPSLPGGKLPSEPCDEAKGIRCRNHFCLGNAFCSALCVDDSDCPSQYKCQSIELNLPDGRAVPVKGCMLPRVACKHDSGCPPNQVCQSYLKPTQDALDFFCAPVNPKGAVPGNACDPSLPDTCYNNLCIDAGYCFSTCEKEADCRAGFTCVEANVQLPKGKGSFKGCAVKNVACKKTKDCADGLVCVLGIDQTQTKLSLFCNVPVLHSKSTGSSCTPQSTDPKQRCQSEMCIREGYCSALCVVDDDCPKDYKCTELSVQVKDKIETIHGCTKAPPP